MNRPLERCGIDELEALARKMGNNETELKVLENELTHRSSSRAEKLLAEVRRAQKSKEMPARIHAKVEANKLAQEQLFGMAGTQTKIPIIASRPDLSAPEPTRLSPTLAKVPIAPLAIMTDEQAYKCLKVSPSADWEKVEHSRREIVARAQPDKLEGLPPEKCKALQDESRLANAAYKSLLQR